MYMYCDRSAASPLLSSPRHHLNRCPSSGSRLEWMWERGGGAVTTRTGGTWIEWSLVTVAVKCRAHLSSRDRSLFPMHAHWCPRRSRRGEGFQAAGSVWLCRDAHVATVRLREAAATPFTWTNPSEHYLPCTCPSTTRTLILMDTIFPFLDNLGLFLC